MHSLPALRLCWLLELAKNCVTWTVTASCSHLPALEKTTQIVTASQKEVKGKALIMPPMEVSSACSQGAHDSLWGRLQKSMIYSAEHIFSALPIAFLLSFPFAQFHVCCQGFCVKRHPVLITSKLTLTFILNL